MSKHIFTPGDLMLIEEMVGGRFDTLNQMLADFKNMPASNREQLKKDIETLRPLVEKLRATYPNLSSRSEFVLKCNGCSAAFEVSPDELDAAANHEDHDVCGRKGDIVADSWTLDWKP